MTEVTVVFSCGHESPATASLFKEGEQIPIPCRECKPSRIVALLYLGAAATVGSMIFGAVSGQLLYVLGGAIAAPIVAFLLFLFGR